MAQQTPYNCRLIIKINDSCFNITERVTINITSNGWFQEDDNGTPYKCPSLGSRWHQYKQRSDYISGSAAIEPVMQEFSRLLRTPRPSLTTIGL